MRKVPTGSTSLQLQHQRLDSATARERLGWVPARRCPSEPTRRKPGDEAGFAEKGGLIVPISPGVYVSGSRRASYLPFSKTSWNNLVPKRKDERLLSGERRRTGQWPHPGPQALCAAKNRHIQVVFSLSPQSPYVLTWVHEVKSVGRRELLRPT